MTLQTDVRMDGRPDGRGYHNIPAFSSKRAGIMSDETTIWVTRVDKMKTKNGIPSQCLLEIFTKDLSTIPSFIRYKF